MTSHLEPTTPPSPDPEAPDADVSTPDTPEPEPGQPDAPEPEAPHPAVPLPPGVTTGALPGPGSRFTVPLGGMASGSMPADPRRKASAARVHDALLGRLYNFPVDRVAATTLATALPGIHAAVRANRDFLTRTVRHLLRAGVRQFLDLGSGLPTDHDVHQIAQATDPHATVVYVDIDPVAVAYSCTTLAGNPRATIIPADLRKPHDVLDRAELTGLLDLTRPVGLLAVAVLHFVADEDDPVGLLATYRDALAPGSHLVLSHLTADHLTPGQAQAATAAYQDTDTPLTLRTYDQIADLFTGFRPLAPGLVPVGQWRPDELTTAPGPHTSHLHGGAAILDHRTWQRTASPHLTTFPTS